MNHPHLFITWRVCLRTACAQVSIIAAATVAASGSWAFPDGGAGPTMGFPGVGMVGDLMGFDCSGTVVGNGRYVLTAAHCTLDAMDNPLPQDGMRFTAGGMTQTSNAIFRHPTADIAIICFPNAWEGAYQLWCPDDAGSIDGMRFCGVGFGRGSSAGGMATSTWDLPYGNKRVFYNVAGPLMGSVFEADLTVDMTRTPGEGLPGPGDSGGGVFLEKEGMLFLAGVISYGRGGPVVDPYPGPRPGFIAGFESVPALKEWITPRIPAPSTATLVLIGILGSARRRRGR